MRTTGITLASLLFLLAPQQGPAPQQSLAPQQSRLARIDGQTAVVEDGASLAEILDALAPATQRRVLVKRDVAPKLDATKVRLSETLRVPADRAAELLDTLFLPHDFVFVPPTAAELAWGVEDLKGPDRARVRESLTMIQVEEVPTYAKRALLVGVLVTLRSANAREVAGSLRPMYPDAQVNMIASVGSTNQLLLTGTGPTVAKMLDLVMGADKSPVEAEAPPSAVAALQRKVQSLQTRVDALEKEVEGLKAKK